MPHFVRKGSPGLSWNPARKRTWTRAAAEMGTVKVMDPGGLLLYHLPVRTTGVPAVQLGFVSVCQGALTAALSACIVRGAKAGGGGAAGGDVVNPGTGLVGTAEGVGE